MRGLVKRNKGITAILLGMIFVVAFAKIHLRVQSVVVGYEIGKLKTKESDLLEKRSLLRMQVAQLTSRSHLQLVSDSRDIKSSAGRLASK